MSKTRVMTGFLGVALFAVLVPDDMKAPWVREKWDDPYCWGCIHGGGQGEM
ncbi:MAG: hypothetical protein JXA57_01650 [Armatimonadetes bacterium]|nr:hypothetical protein [Armatimonadota bacterium]